MSQPIASAAAIEFWTWFADWSSEIRAAYIAGNQDTYLAFAEAIGAQLDAVAPELSFEFGGEEEVIDFMVSANGVKANFLQARQFAALAPKIAGWRVIPFKQRKLLSVEGSAVRFNGINVPPDQVYFAPLGSGLPLDIEIIFDVQPDVPSEVLWNFAFIYLDWALGEYDVATGIGHIQLATGEKPGAMPFTALPDFFDRKLMEAAGSASVRLN